MFSRKPIVMGVACALAQLAHAQQAPTAAAAPQQLDTIVVTANPLGSATQELVPATSALAGRELDLRRGATLGETLDGLPGVSTSYFGPGVGRPIIRGLDADRIRLMSNGLGVLDASGLSQDHAVPIDPLIVERIEVVRGAGALMYGGNAVGGLVNAIDNRIPDDAIDGVHGRIEGRAGSADHERSGAAVLEAGNGLFALHADAYQRRTRDLAIPGFARSERKRAADPQTDEARDRLPNSNAHGDGGALGASLTFGERGFVGLGYSAFNQNYGSVAETDVRIDMKNARWDAAGEWRNADGFIRSVKFKAGYSDYEHQEIAAGVPETRFINKGREARVEATHGKPGGWQGAFGVQVSDFDFSALGDEAFVPKTDNKSAALFAFEELPLGALKLNVGGRLERARVESDGGGPDDPNTGAPRFGDAQSRRFTPKSATLGGVYTLNPNFSLAGNLSHTERAPSYYELFANGNHAATGVYEVGDTGLKAEKANGLDLQLRWKQGPHSASVAAYYTRFANYVALFNSGNTRAANGELNPAEDPGNPGFTLGGDEILPEARVGAVKARFAGIEAETSLRAWEGAGASLTVNLRADYVRATNLDTGAPLPRISPARFGGGLAWRVGAWDARVDIVHALQQNRVAANELPTDAYTLVNLALAYRVPVGPAAVDAFVKVGNLFDSEARLHTSFLKDVAPLGGRNVVVGLRASF